MQATKRFLWERSAREYADQLSAQGMYSVRVRAVRVRVNQPRIPPWRDGVSREDTVREKRTIFVP